MSEKFRANIEAMRRLTRSLKTLELNLDNVVTDKEYAMGGNMFYVIHSPDAASYINVRFNDVSSPQMKLSRMLGLRVPHERVFITTPSGQSGTLTVLHGLIDPDLFAVIDNRTAAETVLEDILKQLRGLIGAERGSNVTMGSTTVGITAVQVINSWDGRVGWTIQAKKTNTGIIFLGINDLVSTSLCWRELSEGEIMNANNHTGNVWAISDTASQGVWHGEW